MTPTQTRELSVSEREVLEAWLAHDVPLAHGLRQQLGRGTRVFASCDCGCGSIGFVRETDFAQNSSLFGIDALIVDDRGAPIGGMILFVSGGRLHDIDVHSWPDAPLGFPTIKRVRWHERESG